MSELAAKTPGKHEAETEHMGRLLDAIDERVRQDDSRDMGALLVERNSMEDELRRLCEVEVGCTRASTEENMCPTIECRVV